MNQAKYNQWIEKLIEEKSVLKAENDELKAENEDLKALTRKNNKKGKRKAPKVEKRGRLIMFPVKKKGKIT